MLFRNLLFSALGAVTFLGSAAQAQDSTGSALVHAVCFDTTVGEFCVSLRDDVAPATVANFLNYVSDGDYDGTFFHRNAAGFVVQGGGYSYSDTTKAVTEVPKDSTVVNEYNLLNTRGTIAMAKLSSDPNSATSEWFINLDDNSVVLGPLNNSGFTVFGEVLGNGMAVIDQIESLPRLDLTNTLGGAFNTTPVLKVDNNITNNDFVLINRAYETTLDVTTLPENPVTVPSAIANYNGIFIRLPVRYNGKLYLIVMDRISTPPTYQFRTRTNQIIELIDVGQEYSVFSDGLLTIDSMVYGTQLLKNVVLEVTNGKTLEFQLKSYELP